MVGFRQVTHGATLYGFLTAIIVAVCITILAALNHADPSVIAILAGLGGTGVGVAGGVAIPRGTTVEGNSNVGLADPNA